MADRGGQLDVAHALPPDLALGDLHAAAVADLALVADLLVLAAVALPVLGGPEDALAEQAVPLGLEGAVIDGLRQVLYFANYIVTEPGETPLIKNQILSEKEYRDMREKYEDDFQAGMGAEAVKKLLSDMDLEQLSTQLHAELRNASGQKKARIVKRLEVVDAFRLSGNKPEWMIIDDGPAGVVHPLAQQVLAEAALLALEHVAQGLQRPVVGSGDRPASAAAVDESVQPAWARRP